MASSSAPANLLGIKIFFSKEQITQEILKTLEHSKIKDAYIRIILTRGEGPITLDPTSSFHNNLVIIVGQKPAHPKRYYEQGMSLYLAETQRNSIKSVDPNAKSGNYLNNVIALKEAKDYGADDAIMLNANKELTEGSNFNIWLIKDGVYYTPPVKSGLLAGITRAKVLELIKRNKLPYSEQTLFKDNIFKSDEVFITSSTRGVMPISKINENHFGSHMNDWPNTLKVSKLYDELIKTQISQGKYRYL